MSLSLSSLAFPKFSAPGVQLLVPVLGATLYVSEDTFVGVLLRRGVRFRRIRISSILCFPGAIMTTGVR